MSQVRENLQRKLEAFRATLHERRITYHREGSGMHATLSERTDHAADELLDAVMTTILHTHALVEALAAKKGIKR